MLAKAVEAAGAGVPAPMNVDAAGAGERGRHAKRSAAPIDVVQADAWRDVCLKSARPADRLCRSPRSCRPRRRVRHLVDACDRSACRPEDQVVHCGRSICSTLRTAPVEALVSAGEAERSRNLRSRLGFQASVPGVHGGAALVDCAWGNASLSERWYIDLDRIAVLTRPTCRPTPPGRCTIKVLRSPRKSGRR